MNFALNPRMDLSKLLVLGLAAVAGVTVGACFNGKAAKGLPCTADDQCGTQLQCIDGLCGGEFACGDGELLDSTVVCDGVADCPEAEDEDYDLCFGEGQSFECDDGIEIPEFWVCDDEADCANGEDESVEACGTADEVGTDTGSTDTDTGTGSTDTTTGTDTDTGGELGPNQCGDAMDDALSHESLPGLEGADETLGVMVGDFVAGGGPDIVTAGGLASAAQLIELPMGGMPVISELPGPGVDLPYDGRLVVDMDQADFDGDQDADDFVIATEDEDIGLYVYRSDGGATPEIWGQPTFLSPMILLNPQLVSVSLGDINGDDDPDLVALVDTANVNGILFVAIGDKAAPGQNESYFTPMQSLVAPLEYDTYFDAELADIDDDGLDDFVVSGMKDGAPTIWALLRSGAGLDSWNMAEQIMTPMPAHDIAFGDLRPDGFPELVIANATMGRIEVLQSNGMIMGGFMPMTAGTDLGSGVSSLTIYDFNCDDKLDIVFTVGDPAKVQVLFGDGEGGISPDFDYEIATEGEPGGLIALGRFDMDDSTDVVQASNATGDAPDPEVHLHLTSAP